MMILKLLQLSSSALPLGAYSYSEGLETAIEKDQIRGKEELQQWMSQELSHGAIRLETALMLRGYRCWVTQDWEGLQHWNHWTSAVKETSELRKQSWQMGNTLIRLLLSLETVRSEKKQAHWGLEPGINVIGNPCNYGIAFGIGAAHWQIEEHSAVLGYLHSWATNLMNAGVKLIPMGQTLGQQLLLELHPEMETAATSILTLQDDDLYTCSWGLGLASMKHEIQYTRLFRS